MLQAFSPVLTVRLQGHHYPILQKSQLGSEWLSALPEVSELGLGLETVPVQCFLPHVFG